MWRSQTPRCLQRVQRHRHHLHGPITRVLNCAACSPIAMFTHIHIYRKTAILPNQSPEFENQLTNEKLADRAKIKLQINRKTNKQLLKGCKNPAACNYDENAKIDDSTMCRFQTVGETPGWQIIAFKYRCPPRLRTHTNTYTKTTITITPHVSARKL